MKRLKVIALVTVLTLAFAGCSKKVDNTKKQKSVTTEAPTIEAKGIKEPEATQNTETQDGKERSKLTNEWIAADKAAARPYAVMLSNIKVASPQSGISQAGIVYECLVEGGITRLMGVFDEFDAEKIGSIRSARHYYVSLADEYDAIICHYGQSKYTEPKIEELGVDNLSGLSSVGTTVYERDSSIKSPHNVFASYDSILKGTKKMKYRTEYRKNLVSHYNFYEEDTVPKSDTDANTVTIEFSKAYSPVFSYDNSSKEYVRSQFGTEHVDKTTGKPLMFKNLIIQFVKESTMDKVGRQDMDLAKATGEGYYISDGKAVKIKWKKNESEKIMEYYDESGEKLTVNTGKTYIALFPEDKASQITFK